jgi:hypothetical protein
LLDKVHKYSIFAYNSVLMKTAATEKRLNFGGFSECRFKKHHAPIGLT